MLTSSSKKYETTEYSHRNSSGKNDVFALIYFMSLFFPFPALPAGNNTGIQLGHLLTIFFFCWFFVDILSARRVMFAYLILIIPPIVSYAINSTDPVNLNATVAMALALLTIVVSSFFLKSSFYFCIYGVVASIAFHGFVGIVQQYYYLNELFPFLDLYNNPSFAAIDDGVTWQTYALYTKRSFGLLPEPSAMFATIAPWLLLLCSLLFSSKSKLQIGLSVRYWFYISCGLGFLLVYLGRSGGTPVLIFFVIPIVIDYSFRQLRTGSMKGLATFIFIVSVFLFLLISFFFDLQDRVVDEVQKSGSWDERLATISYSISALFNGEPLDALFGYGMGVIAAMAYTATGSTGVHSWIFAYFMGTGLLGVASFIFLFCQLFASIFKSTRSTLGFGILFLWLFVATFVTGYLQLLSMWSMLALLLTWHEIFLVPRRNNF